MTFKQLLLVAGAGTALAVPATASADAVVAPAPGAANLTAGGGYHAWMAPEEDTGWRLVVRRPDGTVTRPRIPGFSGPPEISIGSLASPAPNRDVVVAYSRPTGGYWQYNLRTNRESRIGAISSPAYKETLVAVQNGGYVFTRTGGPRNGIYATSRSGRLRRVTTAIPRLLATNGSRVAYVDGDRVVVRRISGEGSVISFRSPARVLGLTLTRYRVGWLARGGRVFQSARFGGSGPDGTAVATEAGRQLPESARSIADDDSNITRYLDGEGVKSIDPPLFRR